MSAPEDTPPDTTTLGAHPIAPRNDQTIEIRATYLVVVVVRDRLGSPIEGAMVTVWVDGSGQDVRTTDATGLVEPPFVVVPRRNVVVSARFPAVQGAEPTPGGLAVLPDAVALDVAAIESRARPPAKECAEPLWPDLGASNKVLFLTLQPSCKYYRQRHFPWQNPILRDLVYRKDPQEHNDPGQRTASGELVVEANKDRKQRLRDFIGYFAKHVPGAKSVTAHRQTHPGLPRSTPDLDQLERRSAAKEDLFADLRRVERRIEWLRVFVIPKRGPQRTPPPPDETLEGEQEGAPHPSLDVGAGQRREDWADASPEYADPKWRDLDVSTPRREVDSLTRRRKEMLARLEKLDPTGSELEDAHTKALTHRELIEYIVSEMFGNDPDREMFPGWLRYAVLHFSGLRYGCAHGSSYPPELILGKLREQEIAEEKANPLDRHRLAIFVEEHVSRLLSDPIVRDGVLSASNRTALAKGKALSARSMGGRLFAASAMLRGEPAGKSPPTEAAARSALDETIVAFFRHFLARMNDLALRQASLSPASGDSVPPDHPLTDAWGLLVRARDTGKLPPEAWPAVVQFTELRNDFVNVPEVAFRPPPTTKDEQGKVIVLPPKADPPPVDGSRWPVLAPPLSGFSYKLYPDFAYLFGNTKGQHWKTQQAGDLSLVASRAVCNQITEMVGAARGLKLGGAIPGNAATMDEDDDVQVKERRLDDGDPDPIGETILDAGRLMGLVGSLSLGTSASRVRRGDFLFFLEWRQIGGMDQYTWVSPFLGVPHFRLETRSTDEPRPMTRAEAQDESDALQAKVKAWKARKAEWEKRADEAKRARRKAEQQAQRAAAREHPPRKLPPAVAPPGGFPGEQPFPEPKPAPPPPLGRPIVDVVKVSNNPPVFTIQGRQIPVIESWKDPRIRRGEGQRPAPVDPDIPGDITSQPWSAAEQIALLKTTLPDGDPLAYIFVRRHPRSKVYTELLGWVHIATIVEPPGAHGRLMTFETWAPTGIAARTWRSTDHDNWKLIFGHMAGQDESLPYLEAYLDPELLLDPNALPPGDKEDR